MRKVYGIVESALLTIGAISIGESVDAAIGQKAIQYLNNLLNSWSTTRINPIRYDKRVSSISTTTDHISCGTYVPEDSVPVANSRRIYVTIPRTIQDGDFINISLNETVLPSVGIYASPGFNVQNRFANAINTADLGVTAVAAGPFKVLLTSNEDIGIYCTTSSPVPRGDYKYTGDFATRASSLRQVSILMTDLVIPVKVLSFNEYRQIAVPNVSAIPSAAYMDTNFPIQNIYLYPNISSGYGIHLLGEAYFDGFDSLQDSAEMVPFELEKPLIICLAADLAPIFGQTIDQSAIINAMSTLKHIKTRNTVNNIMTPRSDMGGSRSPNYLSGL